MGPLLESLGIERPKIDGVFAKPTTEDGLLGDTLGKSDEHLSSFGKRMLILLETQPVHGISAYGELVTKLLERYARGYVAKEPYKEWTFLLNDLMRYFRSLCVNYQWDFENNKQKWPIRNVKLRHSRLIMYAGLLTLLGECSKEREDKVQWLRRHLFLTPLERLACVYALNGEWCFHRVAGPYDVFLNKLNDSKAREALKVGGDYDDRYAQRLYVDLKVNSDSLVAEMLRFILARRGQWSERFFEYLIL